MLLPRAAIIWQVKKAYFAKLRTESLYFGTVNYGKLNIQVHAISVMEKKYT